jgi:hypothetical protein
MCYETTDNELMTMIQWPSNLCPACAVHEWERMEAVERMVGARNANYHEALRHKLIFIGRKRLHTQIVFKNAEYLCRYLFLLGIYSF